MDFRNQVNQVKQEKVFKRSPESKFYDNLKGKEVIISWKYENTPQKVILLWVDRYSIGVKTLENKEVMVFKDAIKTLTLSSSQP